jgi:hypothetical protein
VQVKHVKCSLKYMARSHEEIQEFPSSINGSKTVERMWMIVKEAAVQKCTDPMS